MQNCIAATIGSQQSALGDEFSAPREINRALCPLPLRSACLKCKITESTLRDNESVVKVIIIPWTMSYRRDKPNLQFGINNKGLCKEGTKIYDANVPWPRTPCANSLLSPPPSEFAVFFCLPRVPFISGRDYKVHWVLKWRCVYNDLRWRVLLWMLLVSLTKEFH